MHTSSIIRVLSGAAAMLAASAALAGAQTTTSTQRIPITKESPGEVARVDTVTIYHTDTLNMPATMRVDTVTVTNTVTQVDTVTQTLRPPVRLPSGMYFGLAAGVSAPNGAIYNPNSAGPSAQAQLGWQRAKSLLGLRLDANWTKPGEDSFYSSYQADPDILNFNGDVKLQLPIMHHLFGMSPRFSIYGIGGASYVMYKDLPIRLNPGEPGGIAPINVRVGDTPWEHNWGWNAGGGASLAWNRVELFAEARDIQFNTDITPVVRQIPFVLGMNWY